MRAETASSWIVLVPVRVLVFGQNVRTTRYALVGRVKPERSRVVGRKRAVLRHARSLAHKAARVAKVDIVRHIAARLRAEQVNVGADYAVVLVQRGFHAHFVAHDIFAEPLQFARAVYDKLRHRRGISVLYVVEGGKLVEVLERCFPLFVELGDVAVFFRRPFAERGVAERPALCGHSRVERIEGIELVEIFDCGNRRVVFPRLSRIGVDVFELHMHKLAPSFARGGVAEDKAAFRVEAVAPVETDFAYVVACKHPVRVDALAGERENQVVVKVADVLLHLEGRVEFVRIHRNAPAEHIVALLAELFDVLVDVFACFQFVREAISGARVCALEFYAFARFVGKGEMSVFVYD